MKTSTKIACPNDTKRHEVTLNDDGSVTCDCANGLERGRSYAGRLMLGAPPIEGARGCAVLVALVEAAPALMQIAEGHQFPEYGNWAESVNAYGKNPVYLAALARAAKAVPERTEVRKLLLETAERAGYEHSLGKRRFRTEFRAIWDVPATAEALNCFVVSAYDDDSWNVPYVPGWKEQIFDKGLALLDGKLVVGRSPEATNRFFAVTPGLDASHVVFEHDLIDGKLHELPF